MSKRWAVLILALITGLTFSSICESKPLRRKQQEVRRENGIISRHASLRTAGKSHPPLRAVTYLGSGTQQDWMGDSR